MHVNTSVACKPASNIYIGPPPKQVFLTLDEFLDGIDHLHDSFIDRWLTHLTNLEIGYKGHMGEVDAEKVSCAFLYFNNVKSIQQTSLTTEKKEKLVKNFTVKFRRTLKDLSFAAAFHQHIGEINKAIAPPKQSDLISADIAVAIDQFKLHKKFPDEALAEAAAMPKEIPDSEIDKRVDLRKEEAITIDPDAAKDFDDAVSIKKLNEGRVCLKVHIADVAHYIKPGSAIDREAQARANSTYFPGVCLPMLPPALSEELCSLQPDKDRLTITTEMIFDKDGNLLHSFIYRSVIRSQMRFTYKEAKACLDGEKEPKFRPMLQMMEELALSLRNKRNQRGSLMLNMPEQALQLDEQGNMTGIEHLDYDITHQLIEEFMLKANEAAALKLSEVGLDLPYRIHPCPDMVALEELREWASTTGHNIFNLPKTEELAAAFINPEFKNFIAVQLIRRMKPAAYSIKNIGHYGLQLSHYCHSTSPIRRYIDVVVQRLLTGEYTADLNWVADHASEMEKISDKAEKYVKMQKKIRYIENQFLNEPNKTYASVITNINPEGLAFEVKKFALEGFFKVSNLGKNWYFDTTTKRLFNKRSGKALGLGSKIQVRIKDVDKVRQKVFWSRG